MLATFDDRYLDQVAERLVNHDRAQILGLLVEGEAQRLYQEARAVDYNVVTTGETGHLDFPSVWLDSLDPKQKNELGRRVQAAATTRFQYLFDNHPIYDLAQSGQAAPIWAQLVSFLNGEAFLALMRRVTGEPSIALADAQLTRFRPGHFLTRHDDLAEGKNRYFAYVLSLTPVWDPDWGGLLAFHDADDNLAEAFTPRFNTLNLLRTPQPHAVTQVALYAGADRISITGWLRGANAA